MSPQQITPCLCAHSSAVPRHLPPRSKIITTSCLPSPASGSLSSSEAPFALMPTVPGFPEGHGSKQCWGLSRAQNVSPRKLCSECQPQGQRFRRDGLDKKTKYHARNWHRGEKIFSKPPTHRTPLVPSGYHRCLVTAEICLPEAGTREYFWPN